MVNIFGRTTITSMEEFVKSLPVCKTFEDVQRLQSHALADGHDKYAVEKDDLNNRRTSSAKIEQYFHTGDNTALHGDNLIREFNTHPAFLASFNSKKKEDDNPPLFVNYKGFKKGFNSLLLNRYDGSYVGNFYNLDFYSEHPFIVNDFKNDYGQFFNKEFRNKYFFNVSDGYSSEGVFCIFDNTFISLNGDVIGGEELFILEDDLQYYLDNIKHNSVAPPPIYGATSVLINRTGYRNGLVETVDRGLCQKYDACFIQSENAWYSEEYANENFYFHENFNEWWDFPEEDREDYDDYDDDDDDGGGMSCYDGELDDYGFNPLNEWGCEHINEKGIRQYSNSPVKGVQYFGLELEYELKDPCSDDIDNVREIAHNHNCGACEDGSLNEGVEFKTQPLSITLAKLKVSKLLMEVKPYVRAYRTCGLHIHVSRSSLTPLQIGLMQDFMYNRDNDVTINALAGRRPNAFCSRSGNYGLTGRMVKQIPSRGKGRKEVLDGIKKCPVWHKGGDKYEAINFGHDHTIEFRLFAASVQEFRVLGRLEFVKALIDYTSVNNRLKKEESRKWANFHSYVIKNKKNYPNLIALFEDKNLLENSNNNSTNVTVEDKNEEAA